MLSAKITIDKDADELFQLFELEEKKFQNERAEYSLEKRDDELDIIVKSKDSVALRSVLNTITKIITVHEKAGEVVENGKRN